MIASIFAFFCTESHVPFLLRSHNARVNRGRLFLQEPGRIHIGAGCLLASDVDISVSDLHPIFNADTGARINPSSDIEIGDRVWVVQRSMVLKGARIGHDSVIGGGSVVTRNIPAHCIAAGNPARVIRTGIRWSMTL